jgi:ribosome-associated heat shock protein Hsp15
VVTGFRRSSGAKDNLHDGPSLLTEDRQRIDKWLWHARVVRTRSAAAELAASGHVRLNGARVAAPSKAVRAGDVVTIALDARVRVLKVTGFALRRGGAAEGLALYEDLAPPRSGEAAATDVPAPVARRDSGSGRPTKQERRAIERFTRDTEV